MIAAIEAFFGTTLGRWCVVGALVLSALFAGGVYERSVGYREGVDVGAKREQEQEAANAKAAAALDAKYRASEQAHQNETKAIGDGYEKQLADSKTQHDADVAAARAGRVRLSIPAPQCSSNAGGVPNAPSGSAVDHGPARTDLPAEITASLFGLADDADAVAQQLTACQAILQSERKAP